ncbi:MAG: serine protease [Actinomycetota bacterium]|nr:serine protease [Actinomycetota bacterium]
MDAAKRERLSNAPWPAVGRLLEGQAELGTCFAISDALALTAWHCVERRQPVAEFGGTAVPVDVEWYASDLDVALLRLAGALPDGARPFRLLDRLPPERLPWKAVGFNQGRVGLDPVTITGEVSRVGEAAPVTEIQLTCPAIGHGLPAVGFSGSAVQADEPVPSPVAFAVVRRGIPDPADERLRLGGLVYATPTAAVVARYPDLGSAPTVRLATTATHPMGWPARLRELPAAAEDALLALSAFGREGLALDAAAAAVGGDGVAAEEVLAELRREGLLVDRDGRLAVAAGLLAYIREHRTWSDVEAEAWERVGQSVVPRLFDAARLLGVVQWASLPPPETPVLVDLPSCYRWLRSHLDLAVEVVRRRLEDRLPSAWQDALALAVCLMNDPASGARRRLLLTVLEGAASVFDPHGRRVTVLTANQLRQVDGLHDEVLSEMPALIAELEAEGDETGAALASAVLAGSCGWKSEWRRALELLEPAVERLRGQDDPLALAGALVWLGHVRNGAGQTEAAGRAIAEAKAIAAGTGNTPLLAHILLLLAEERLRQGRPDLAADARADVSRLLLSLAPMEGPSAAPSGPGAAPDLQAPVGGPILQGAGTRDAAVLDAEDLLVTAAELAADLGADQLRIAALTTLARLSNDVGDYAAARRHQELLVQTLADIGDAAGRAVALVNLAMVEIAARRFRAAESALGEAELVLGQVAGDARAVAQLRLVSAQLALALGRPKEAAGHAGAALRGYEQLEDGFNRRWCEAFLGLALQADGNRRGLDLIQRAADEAARLGPPRQAGDLMLRFGLALSAAGEVLRAAAVFEVAADRLAAANEHRIQAYAWGHAGRSWAYVGDHARGFAALERAVARFVALDDEAGAAAMLASLASAKSAAQDHAGAFDALGQASALAGPWRDPASELELRRLEAGFCLARLDAARASEILVPVRLRRPPGNEAEDALVLLDLASAEQAKGSFPAATEYVQQVQGVASGVLAPAWYVDTVPRLHQLAMAGGDASGGADELDGFLGPVVSRGTLDTPAADDALLFGYANRGFLSVTAELARRREASGPPDRREAANHRALAIASGLCDRPLRAWGEWRAVAASHRADHDEVRVVDLVHLGGSALRVGAVAASVEVLQQAIALADRLGYPGPRVQARQVLWSALRQRGVPNAAEHLVAAQRLATTFRHRGWLEQLAMDRAQELEVANPVEAQLWVREALRHATARGATASEVACRARMVRLFMATPVPAPGQPAPPPGPAVADEIDAVIHLATTIGDPEPRANTLVSLATTWLQAVPPIIVRRVVDEALAAARLGGRRTWIRTRLWTAGTLLQTGAAPLALEGADEAVRCTDGVTDLLPSQVAAHLIRARARAGVGDPSWWDDVAAAWDAAGSLEHPLDRAEQAVHVVITAFDLLGAGRAVTTGWVLEVATTAERLCREGEWLAGQAQVMQRIGVGLAERGDRRAADFLQRARGAWAEAGNAALVSQVDQQLATGG